MARYERDFPDYASLLQLDMRQVPEGGPVRRPCTARWRDDRARPQPDLLVLVHGFNNHRAEAQEAYVAFRRRQGGLAGAAQADRLESTLGDAFWPGDARFAGPLDRVDFVVYPATIEKAQAAAVELSGYLQSRHDVLSLSFIGHSMGCRVILETIRLLQAAGYRPRIRKVCLMAAAVRTAAVSPGGDLAPAFLAAEQVQVLHSPADAVLSGAFPLGQTLAGDGVLPAALGLYADVPHQPGHVDVEQIHGAGHSDYWGWGNNAASGQAAAAIRRFLDASPDRTLAVRTPAHPVGLQPREFAEPRMPGG